MYHNNNRKDLIISSIYVYIIQMCTKKQCNSKENSFSYKSLQCPKQYYNFLSIMEWFYLTLETVPNNSIIVKQLQENKTIKLECNTMWWSAIYFMR